jgi:hypothetical protein
VRLGAGAGLWWLAPAGAVAVVVPLTLTLAWLLDDTDYRTQWRTGKWLTTDTVLLLFAGAVVFMVGSMLPLLGRSAATTRREWPGWGNRTYLLLLRASRWLFLATMFGYVALALAGLRNGVRPADLFAAIAGQNTYNGDLKAAFAPITGITTFTQVGIAYVVVAAVLLSRGRAPGVALRLSVVLGLAMVRAYLLSERLAILELVVPLIAVVAMARYGDGRAWVRRAIKLAPVIMIPGVVAVFAVFEYSRSWIFFQAQSGGGFLQFATMRLAGYYVTAYNNGQIALLFDSKPGRLPYETVEAFWTAPGVSQLGLYDRFSNGGGAGTLLDLLAAHANPEFNNSCGLCAPFLDWGPLGGLVWLFVAGVVLGLVYRAFRDGRPLAVLVYPTLVTGLFELPRYLYWTQGRLVPGLLGLVITGLWVERRTRSGRAPT